MKKENIILEEEKEENIWRRKISFCGGEEKLRRKIYLRRTNKIER